MVLYCGQNNKDFDISTILSLNSTSLSEGRQQCKLAGMYLYQIYRVYRTKAITIVGLSKLKQGCQKRTAYLWRLEVGPPPVPHRVFDHPFLDHAVLTTQGLKTETSIYFKKACFQKINKKGDGFTIIYFTTGKAYPL